MGESLRRLKTAGREVTIDLNAPHLTIARSDLHAFAISPESAACVECDLEKGRRGICAAHYDPERARARCLRALIHAIVRGALGPEIGRADSRVYAALLEELDTVDDGHTTLNLTLEIVRWLLKLATKEEAKIAAGLAQWREALISYLEIVTQTVEDAVVEQR